LSDCEYVRYGHHRRFFVAAVVFVD
jgi:hypothetical protein